MPRLPAVWCRGKKAPAPSLKALTSPGTVYLTEEDVTSAALETEGVWLRWLPRPPPSSADPVAMIPKAVTATPARKMRTCCGFAEMSDSTAPGQEEDGE